MYLNNYMDFLVIYDDINVDNIIEKIDKCIICIS